MLNDDRQLDLLGGHGILEKADLPSLAEACRKVFDLMKDGRWYTAEQIEEAAGQREGLRRMRELRQRGHEIETRRDGDARRFLYKLTPRKKRASASEMWRRS